MTKQINELLAAADISITNAQQDVLIQQRLMTSGMDMAKLHEGAALVHRVQELLQQRSHEAAQSKAFTKKYQTQQKAVHKMYMHHFRQAKFAFDDNVQAKADLRLNGRRARGYADWIQEVRNFYDAVTSRPAYQEQMVAAGTPQAQLHQAMTLTKAVPEFRAQRDLHRGETQHLTEALDDAVRELKRWYSLFKAVARHAFADTPQQLEKLGL